MAGQEMRATLTQRTAGAVARDVIIGSASALWDALAALDTDAMTAEQANALRALARAVDAVRRDVRQIVKGGGS